MTVLRTIPLAIFVLFAVVSGVFLFHSSLVTTYGGNNDAALTALWGNTTESFDSTRVTIGESKNKTADTSALGVLQNFVDTSIDFLNSIFQAGYGGLIAISGTVNSATGLLGVVSTSLGLPAWVEQAVAAILILLVVVALLAAILKTRI
jgi:hypothetical protein